MKPCIVSRIQSLANFVPKHLSIDTVWIAIKDNLIPKKRRKSLNKSLNLNRKMTYEIKKKLISISTKCSSRSQEMHRENGQVNASFDTLLTSNIASTVSSIFFFCEALNLELETTQKFFATLTNIPTVQFKISYFSL